MKLAFSKPTSTNAEQQELFSLYREIGYDGLQLKGGQYSAYLGRAPEFVGNHGHLPGVSSALIAGGPLTEDGINGLRRIMAFGRKVSAELIVFCHAQPREGVSDDDIREYARTLTDLGFEARGMGLKLTLHNHYNQPVMYRKDIETFFGAVEGGVVGLTVDTAHLVASGVTDVAGVIRDFAHVIDNFHLKDFADGQFKVLGQGAIDFAPIFDAIHAIDYDGWVSTDEESGSAVKEAMEICYTFMTQGLRQ